MAAATVKSPGLEAGRLEEVFSFHLRADGCSSWMDPWCGTQANFSGVAYYKIQRSRLQSVWGCFVLKAHFLGLSQPDSLVLDSYSSPHCDQIITEKTLRECPSWISVPVIKTMFQINLVSKGFMLFYRLESVTRRKVKAASRRETEIWIYCI